jgi:acyl carrier protein
MNEQQRLIVLQHLLDVADLELSIADLRPEMSLRDDLNFDSLVSLEMLMQLEETFDVSVANKEATGIETIGDVFSLLESKLGPTQ